MVSVAIATEPGRISAKRLNVPACIRTPQSDNSGDTNMSTVPVAPARKPVVKSDIGHANTPPKVKAHVKSDIGHANTPPKVKAHVKSDIGHANTPPKVKAHVKSDIGHANLPAKVKSHIVRS